MSLTDYPAGLPVRTEADADERLQAKLVDFLVPSQGVEIDANRDLHTLSKIVDEAGAAFSDSNPLPVKPVEYSGTEVHNYKQDDLAQGAGADHDYTASAELKFYEVICSGSGAARFEIKVETGVATGLFNTKAVLYTSASDKNAICEFKVPLVVATGVKVRIIKTNQDKGTQSLSSTIIGSEG